MASQKYTSSATPLLPPREFPASGFEVIDPSQSIEEERLPSYNRDHYYPMRIGVVLEDRYQVVAKLGYGLTSTVWLCRDLREGKYWALKVHVHTLEHNQERVVFRHLDGVTEEHPGRQYIRGLKDSFKLQSRHGEHEVFIMTPLGVSLKTLQGFQKTHTFQQVFVMCVLNQVLLGLDFLHEAEVIHTDIHWDNLIVALADDSVLADMEELEINKPSARKQVGDSITYVSRFMLGGAGALTICDFGGARIGKEHTANAMPVPYRAPEIILNMKWGSAVDIWSVGLLVCTFLSRSSGLLTPLVQAWDLLERGDLFTVYSDESVEENDAHHLAAMTALMGPPPPEFLKRSKETSKFWNEDGKWKGPVPLPTDRTFESLSTLPAGEDRDLFLDLITGFLAWLPEDRLTAGQAYFHSWMRRHDSEA